MSLLNPESLFTRSFEKIETRHRVIYNFSIGDTNIDRKTVESFGDEWQAFHGFEEKEILDLGDEYFDIITPAMLNHDTRVLEVGCGSGRFLKYLTGRSKFIVGADPSHAIFAANDLIGKDDNISLVRASANELPFADGSFDFVYSIGVLHHIPDTANAMQACVNKVRKGGYFFTYLYYNLDNRGWLFRTIFNLSTLLRRVVSRMPSGLKHIVCNILAVLLYMPFVLFSRFLKILGAGEKVRSKIPLYGYENKSFYIIRNDALDRFGTPLEQRFTKQQITKMMEDCGLDQIVFSNNIPFWHAVGRKK